MNRTDEKTYIITLSDGTKIENLSLNGDNYICEITPEELRSMFDGNLRPVHIDGEYHDEMEVIHITPLSNGETWFTLRDMPESKKMERKNRADIEYLAMMTDNELEDM